MATEAYTQAEIDTVVDHALIAWLWSETDEDGTPLDATHSIHEVCVGARDAWTREVARFLEANHADLQDAGLGLEQIGHDFTLTRNGHGVGFWDRNLGEVGERLTASCADYSEVRGFVNRYRLIERE